MEGCVISKAAQKVQYKFKNNMDKYLTKADEVTTLLQDKPSVYLVYDSSLGRNAAVPSVGTPSLCSILQRRQQLSS